MHGLDDFKLHHLFRQKPQRPFAASFRWLGAGQGGQFGLLFAVENRLDRGCLAPLAAERRLETLLDQAPPHPIDHADIGLQRLGNPFIRPTRAHWTGIRLQQNTRLQKGARRRLALADQVLQMGSFFRRQIDNISLL